MLVLWEHKVCVRVHNHQLGVRKKNDATLKLFMAIKNLSVVKTSKREHLLTRQAHFINKVLEISVGISV